ncbi:hypothetical protein [Kibdelosporangium aridum]|uniref:Uncharacterized protein n=1 Tax=Kibdelosporangium aridum TaxID=2030 RepID=A0A1Y5X031_KIBAR|nr:hypothetical protein [Kibdelosporangium aridum]SMC62157.1 hypothetical protein SAMN05661093_00976 [Kibdelosporangium aridum]
MLKHWARRLTVVTFSGLLGFSLLTALPAHATLGDVLNRLPSNYVVKVAEFGMGTQSCRLATTTVRCAHWWLPSGQSDDQIRPGMDTDAFMVEREVLVIRAGLARRVPAFEYTQIGDLANVECRVDGGPVCIISQ